MTDRERFQALLRAIAVHRQLVESGEIETSVADDALWQVAEILTPKCNGGCCG